MDFSGDIQGYLIIKGFINGRDLNGQSVYGLFIAVSNLKKLFFLKEHFSFAPIAEDAPWEYLLDLVTSEADESREAILDLYEKELHDFIDIQRIFVKTKGRFDQKEVERKIAYFCSDTLDISAITFLEISNTANEEDLFALMPFMEDVIRNAEQADVFPEDEEAEKVDEVFEEAEDGEVFILCEPVLDPLSGVAISDLTVGDTIACKIPDDSAFFKFLQNTHPDFDGVIEGLIKGIRQDEYGTAVVALNLADGVSGALKLSGRVRIKLLTKKNKSDGNDAQSVSLEMILAIASLMIFLVIMAVLLYMID